MQVNQANNLNEIRRSTIKDLIKNETFVAFKYNNVLHEGFVIKCNLNENYERAFGTITLANNTKQFLTGVENIKFMGL